MVCALASACGTKITQPQDVRGLRVLAILSDPPEAHPGDTVRLRVVVGGTTERVVTRWSVCARTEEASTSLPISSFGQFSPDEGCDGASAADVRPLDADGPGSNLRVPVDALENDAWLAAAFAGPISRERRRELAQVAGLQLVVTVNVTAGTETLRAFERITVFPAAHSEPLNTNPPRPALTFDETAIAPLSSDVLEEECRGASDVVVAPGARVVVTPRDEDTSWYETYTILDAAGQRITVRENALYNFFATAGTWELGRPRQPDRAPTWVAPMEPGEVTFWLTLRDGRGGTSVCRYVAQVR